MILISFFFFCRFKLLLELKKPLRRLRLHMMKCMLESVIFIPSWGKVLILHLRNECFTANLISCLIWWVKIIMVMMHIVSWLQLGLVEPTLIITLVWIAGKDRGSPKVTRGVFLLAGVLNASLCSTQIKDLMFEVNQNDALHTALMCRVPHNIVITCSYVRRTASMNRLQKMMSTIPQERTRQNTL